MAITINENTTFLISDELGNVTEGAELGLYHEDTRFLCLYELTLDDQPPLLLAARAIDYYAALHFLTNPALPAVRRGLLGIVRRRLVGRGMHEDLWISNYGDQQASFSVELRFDADFAHIFEVKRQREVRKEAVRSEGTFTVETAEEGRSLRFRYERGDLLRRLVVNLSQQPELLGSRCQFRLRLAPREQWHLCLDFLTLGDKERGEPMYTCRTGESPGLRERRERRYAEMVRQVPQLETDAYVLQRAYEQSVHDFAALQIKGEAVAHGEVVLAAGIPWFMALFGRDSLIAAYQALLFSPQVAKGVLRVLARLQGQRVDRLRAEEPGKILHEHRYGELTGTQRTIPAFPYYGSIDATPLFLMLLAAVYRVTGDLEFIGELRDSALRALEWMERYGDLDGDGYLEYWRADGIGLENQGWKDSFDSVRFRDGNLARPPIALCEVQGYAYAAWYDMADVFEALGESEQVAEWRQRAVTLRERVNRDFWLPERGYYAEALDGDKQPVDSLTSNPGHLLWAGLADRDKAELVAKRLLSPELYSGWGVRTMGTQEGGYNPISYHNGSVWPHDNSLIVAGLARYGFIDQATQIVDGLLAALGHYPDYRLPELFAGYSRWDAPFPIEYPTASRPQAWASGSIFLLLTAMLGFDAATGSFAGAPFLPSGVRYVRLRGLHVGGACLSVEIFRSGTGIRRRIDGANLRDASG